jgi:hypothetical protein
MYLSERYGHVGIVLLERGADKHALNGKAKYHTKYRCEVDIQSLQDILDFPDKIADLLGKPTWPI